MPPPSSTPKRKKIPAKSVEEMFQTNSFSQEVEEAEENEDESEDESEDEGDSDLDLSQILTEKKGSPKMVRVTKEISEGLRQMGEQIANEKINAMKKKEQREKQKLEKINEERKKRGEEPLLPGERQPYLPLTSPARMAELKKNFDKRQAKKEREEANKMTLKEAKKIVARNNAPKRISAAPKLTSTPAKRKAGASPHGSP